MRLKTCVKVGVGADNALYGAEKCEPMHVDEQITLAPGVVVSLVSRLDGDSTTIEGQTVEVQLKGHSHEKIHMFFFGPIPQKLINKTYFQYTLSQNYL